MKKRFRTLVALCAGILFIGLGAGQGLAASGNNGTPSNPSKPSVPKDGLHRDGTAFVKESKITQADRQAAADRAKAQGFMAPMVDYSVTPGGTTQINRGAQK